MSRMLLLAAVLAASVPGRVEARGSVIVGGEPEEESAAAKTASARSARAAALERRTQAINLEYAAFDYGPRTPYDGPDDWVWSRTMIRNLRDIGAGDFRDDPSMRDCVRRLVDAAPALAKNLLADRSASRLDLKLDDLRKAPQCTPTTKYAGYPRCNSWSSGFPSLDRCAEHYFGSRRAFDEYIEKWKKTQSYVVGGDYVMTGQCVQLGIYLRVPDPGAPGDPDEDIVVEHTMPVARLGGTGKAIACADMAFSSDIFANIKSRIAERERMAGFSNTIRERIRGFAP